MDFGISGKEFIVCGATSGFGHAITMQLISEGARVLAIARNEEKLKELKEVYPGNIDFLAGDLTEGSTLHHLLKKVESRSLSGILFNAGGPPAKIFTETTMSDWDQAYRQLVRWKIEMTKALLPAFQKNKFGRLIYIESAAVKSYMENLVLSSSMRLAVVGMVKAISQEIAESGVTLNVLAPGYHQTPAVERILTKKAEAQHKTRKEALYEIETTIPVKHTGSVSHFASLAVWLLSPLSEYVTGQVFTIDGGVVKSML